MEMFSFGYEIVSIARVLENRFMILAVPQQEVFHGCWVLLGLCTDLFYHTNTPPFTFFHILAINDVPQLHKYYSN